MTSQTIRVLLVEDNPTDAELFRRTLSKTPQFTCEVVHVERLAAAKARLTAGGIDVVLLDLNLPDGQGLELIDQVSACAPDVPLVILTGTYEEETLAIQAFQKGVQDYLVKDHVDGYWLNRALRYAIERKRVEAELRAANLELTQQMENVKWLNRIMIEREQRITELEEKVQALRAQGHTQQPPRL